MKATRSPKACLETYTILRRAIFQFEWEFFVGQFFDSLVLLVAGVVLVGALLKLGSRLGGKRAQWLAVVLPLIGIIGAVAAANWALARYGVRAHAAVVGKTEWTTLMPNGSPLKNYSVAIKHRGAGTAQTTNLRTDQRLYDDLAIGDSVPVRSPGWRPSLARLEAMTSARWLRILTDSGLLVFLAGVAATFGGLFLYGGKGTGGAIRKPVALLLLGVGGFSCWQEGRPYRPGPRPTPPAGSAQARVTKIRLISGIYPAHQGSGPTRGWPLEQPYQLIEAEFTPAGARAPIVAVDAIDVGSIPKLAVGGMVDLEYDRTGPRTVHLRIGTRRWSEINGRDAWYSLGAVVGLLGLGLGARLLLFGRRKAR